VFERVRIRLVVANVLVIGGLLLALGVGVVVAMDHFLVDQRAETLRTVAHEVAERLQANPADVALPHDGVFAGTFAAAWSAGGQLIADPAAIGPDALEPAAAAATQDGSQAVIPLPTGGEAVVVSFLAQGGAVIQVGQDLAPVRDVERQVTLLLVLAGSIGLVLALVAGWILADRAVRPIRRAFDRQREFAADASHELRTPLAVVDAGLQVLGRHPAETVGEHEETLGAMRAEVGRMNRLVGGLLTLARADAGAAEIAPVDTDMDALMRGAVAGYAALAAARGASVELGETSAGFARVDPDRIVELLGILVDNALVHGGPGVRVRVDARRPGGVELIVGDNGPGIPEAERSRVTERFVRGDVARSGEGTGLGLSIARWIVDAHRGRLLLEDNRPGLRARVTLPA
jgi:two-component system sensor histidine kinase CiaH